MKYENEHDYLLRLCDPEDCDGDTDVPMACENCGFVAPLALFECFTPDEWLCEICSETYLRPTPNCQDPYLYKSIAWIGNKILATIQDIKVNP